MAGGRGQRFWPLSTSKRPKQLVSLIGGKSLLEITVERLRGLIPEERTLIVTGKALAEASRRTVPSLPPENTIGEPFGRDTAAACALACALVGAKHPDGAFCILTADHVIEPLDAFHETLREGLELALSRDVLITIGIPPTSASTGFGYIEAAGVVDSPGTIEFLSAKRFVEKPDAETAAKYVCEGNYFWNSGMFMWSVKSFRKALAEHQPDLLEMTDRIQRAIGTPDFDSVLSVEYEKLDRISVDYAVMEKAGNIVMAKSTFAWDDVGSWPALESHFETDSSNNVVIGMCEALDSHGNVAVSGERLTALIGVEDLIVVQAENATLICRKDRAQDVKKMVELLSEKGRYADLL